MDGTNAIPSIVIVNKQEIIDKVLRGNKIKKP